MDQIVWAVNPRNDTLESLVNYTSQFAQDLFQLTPIRCRLKAPMDLPSVPLSTEMRHNVFLAIKEALHNVAKHYSGASEVTIHLSLESTSFLISIKDNGKGFSPNEVGSLGNGLCNMEKRIAAAGGKFNLASEAGQGTRIQIDLPLP